MKLHHAALIAIIALSLPILTEAGRRPRTNPTQTSNSAPSKPNCTKRCVRKEIRDLTSSERTAYFNAVKRLMDSGEYARIVAVHADNSATTHGCAGFLPWHRAYLFEVEQALQKIDSSVCLHYWSWDYDSQAPEKSPMFRQDWYGQHGQDGCVKLQWAPNYQVKAPQPGCLRRAYQGRIRAFSSTEIINRLIVRSATYDEFRTNLEGSPHALPHNNIGGHMSTMSSPNDPIFFTHHSFVDKIWASWQRQHSDVANTYGGARADGSAATPNDVLTPYPYRVSDMYRTTDWCYEYQDLSRNGAQVASFDNGGDSDNTDQSKDEPKKPEDKPQDQPNKPDDKPKDEPKKPEDKPRDKPQDKPQDKPDDKSNGSDPKFSIKPSQPNGLADSDDRSDLTKLRVPDPVPKEWIDMNYLEEDKVRTYESHTRTIYESLSKLEGYISPCALYHREDLWKQLTTSVTEFHISIPKLGTINIKISESTSKVVQKCKHYMEKYAHVFYKEPKELYGELVGLIGESAAADPNSPNNPMATPPSATVAAASTTGSAARVFTGVLLLALTLFAL